MQNAGTRAARIAAATLAGFLLSLGSQVNAAQTQSSPAQRAPSVFQEQDAVHLADRLRQALESENRSRTLKLFDASRMPGFPVFRDEITQFYARYEPPSVDYHIQQVSQDGALGAVVVEFVMEALPWTDGQPALHRRAQMRLITGWDAKEHVWKIVDFSPRELFQ